MVVKKGTFNEESEDSNLNQMIMLQDSEIQGVEVPDGMKKIFVSYAILDLDSQQTGFGNSVGLFAPHLYPEGFKQFLKVMEENISKVASERTGRHLGVKILNIQAINLPITKTNMFVSYNSVNINTGQNSFGNFQLIFSPLKYTNNNFEKFLADTQTLIQKGIRELNGQDIVVQLLFFR